MEQLKLTDKIKHSLEDFIQRLKDIYQQGLVSVIIYGSAASGEFKEAHSNINLLVILDNTSLDNLKKISNLINKIEFQKFHPLFFTQDYLNNSTDVFPIEFLDMKENYLVLYGRNILRDLQVDIRNLRFQCEQELKAKLINIKDFYLRNKNDKAAVSNLLFKSFNSVLHILRNLIRFKNKTPAYLKEDILKQINQEFQINISTFNKILEARNKNLRLKIKEVESLLFAFVGELEKIIEIIDRLQPS